MVTTSIASIIRRNSDLEDIRGRGGLTSTQQLRRKPYPRSTHLGNEHWIAHSARSCKVAVIGPPDRWYDGTHNLAADFQAILPW
jgi:hypothetical protein